MKVTREIREQVQKLVLRKLESKTESLEKALKRLEAQEKEQHRLAFETLEAEADKLAKATTLAFHKKAKALGFNPTAGSELSEIHIGTYDYERLSGVEFWTKTSSPEIATITDTLQALNQKAKDVLDDILFKLAMGEDYKVVMGALDELTFE